MAKSIFSALVFFVIILLSCNNQNNPERKDQSSGQNEEKKLKDMIDKYPDSFELKEKLIEYYHVQNTTSVAIEETKKMIVADSTNDRLWNLQANLYEDKNDTANTIISLEKAWSLKHNPDYMKELAYLYALKGNPAALAAADGLMQTQGGNFQEQAVFIKGVYYSSTGDKEKAISIFNQCIQMDYNDMFAYREKAMCLYSLGKYNDALCVLQKATTVKSNYDEGYYWMGACYEKMNQRDKAIENYQAALKIDTNYVEPYNALKRLGVIKE